MPLWNFFKRTPKAEKEHKVVLRLTEKELNELIIVVNSAHAKSLDENAQRCLFTKLEVDEKYQLINSIWYKLCLIIGTI